MFDVFRLDGKSPEGYTDTNPYSLSKIDCYYEPAEFFWSEAEKIRSVGGADKSCISVNKKNYLGTTYFGDGFRLCAGIYQSYDVYFCLGTIFFGDGFQLCASFLSLTRKNDFIDIYMHSNFGYFFVFCFRQCANVYHSYEIF